MHLQGYLRQCRDDGQVPGSVRVPDQLDAIYESQDAGYASSVVGQNGCLRSWWGTVTHRAPVMKIAATPIFFRSGSWSCRTPLSGRSKR